MRAVMGCADHGLGQVLCMCDDTLRVLRTTHNHFRHLVLCVLHRRKLAPSRFGMLQGFSILPRSAASWLTRKRREVIPSRIGQLRIIMQAGRTRRNEMWTDAICVADASVHVCALDTESNSVAHRNTNQAAFKQIKWWPRGEAINHLRLIHENVLVDVLPTQCTHTPRSAVNGRRGDNPQVEIGPRARPPRSLR